MDTKDRPYVICHMMISLDGKISFGTIDGKYVDFSPFGSYMNLYEKIEKSYGEDWSFILGRKTMDEVDNHEEEDLTAFKDSVVVANEDFIAQVDYKHFGISTDTRGVLRWKDNFRVVNGINYGLIMIVNSSTPVEYLAYLKSKNISYIFGGDDELNFELIFEKLKNKFGVKKLLLEGGGAINGSIIKEDLIDEISLMILPFVVNNFEAPALFYTKVTSPKLYHFKLTDTKPIGQGIVY